MKKLIIFLLLAVMIVPLAGCSQKNEPPPVEEVEEEIEEVEEEDVPLVVRKVSPVTVVINNHQEARPQSGLQEASVVYEFLVEGGMTRFLAVYDTFFEENLVIGPVRSLRPYLAVQAMEHGGVIAHSGYSVRTREMIRGMRLKQVTSATYLWRDYSRKAPHNLYTDISKMYKARGDSEVLEGLVEPAELPDGYEDGEELEIVYYSSNKVRYEYDGEKQVYLRFINGKPHTDRKSGQQYSALRVIVRNARHTNVPDPGALVDINLDGSGGGLLYEGGRKYEIRWEKKDGVTRFYYRDGTRVEMDYGNTWIQVVR